MVAVAVTISGGDVAAATFVDGAGSVADPTSVHRTDTGVDVVADAVVVGVGRAVSVADADRVELAHAVVDIVADAVSVRIGGAVTATDAEGVCLVAVAVAIAGGDVGTAAFVDGARSVADAALIELTDTGVDVVTDAVAIRIRGTITATHAEGVELVAIAVTVAGRNVGATAFVDLAGPIAHAAGVVVKTGRRSRVAEVAGRQVGTGVHVVADAVSVAVLAVRNTKQVDIVEGDALVVGIGPHHHLKLQGRSIRNRRLVQVGGREVVHKAGDHRGLAIEDVLEADEVGILKGSHFGEGGADLELGVATHVDFPRGPDTIEVRVAALEDGVAGQHGLEPVRGATIDNAPLGFLSGCVGGAGPSVIEHGLIAEGLLPDDFGADALTAEVGQVAVGVDIAQCQGIAVITGVTDEDTGVVVVRGSRVVVARGRFLATRNFLRVADAVAVGVRRAVAVADAEGIVLAHAVVDIVTDAIRVGIGRAVSATDANGILFTNAGVDIVADAVRIDVGRAVTAAHTDGVELVAEAVAVAGGDAGATTDTALIELVSVAVAVSCRDVRAATFEDRTRSAADTAGVELGAGAVIHCGGSVVVAGRGVSTAWNVRRFCAETRDIGGGERASRSNHVPIDGEAVAAVSVSTAHAISIAVVHSQGIASIAELFRDGNGGVVAVGVGTA